MLSSRQVNSSLWRLGLLWNQAILFHKGIQIHEKLYSLGTRNPSILVIMDDNCMTHTHTVHASINDQCWSIPINDGSNFWHWLIFIERHWELLIGIGVNARNLIRHWSEFIGIDHWYSMSCVLEGFAYHSETRVWRFCLDLLETPS